MVGIAAVPAVAILGYFAYILAVPRYSAVAYFEDTLGFNLRLDLFQTTDDAERSGRYLSVITPSAYRTFNIPGWDWARKARTSLYRIDENHLAVLSALGNDYRITLAPLAFVPLVSDSGEGWQYLGAFDFGFAPGAKPRLEFFNQELAECIPMGTDRQAMWGAMARARARRSSCANPKLQP